MSEAAAENMTGIGGIVIEIISGGIVSLILPKKSLPKYEQNIPASGQSVGMSAAFRVVYADGNPGCGKFMLAVAGADIG